MHAAPWLAQRGRAHAAWLAQGFDLARKKGYAAVSCQRELPDARTLLLSARKLLTIKKFLTTSE
jgi:hypothetical protein